MEKNYKEILEPLIPKMNFEGGRLTHRISKNLLGTVIIDSIWVEFKMENFKYLDPFYGESESNGNFNTFFETTNYDQRIVVDNILQLENKYYDFKTNPMVGSFSNSLDLKIEYCKFGKIEKGKIEFEMKYYLTNSDSYGMMNGSEDEHAEYHKTIKINLNFEDLIVQTVKTIEQESLDNFLDDNVYDLSTAEKYDEVNWRENSKYYKVKIKTYCD
jgi:hypothetical protein